MATVFHTREISAYDAEPIECYEFVVSGRSAPYLYTSHGHAVTVAGKTFVPTTISRSTIKPGTHDEDSTELQIEAPISVGIVQDFGFQKTPPSIALTLYRVHAGTNYATDYKIVWTGKVLSFVIKGETATLSVPSAFALIMKENVPTVCFQPQCGFTLYDSDCKVSRAANIVTTTVVSVTSDYVEVASLGAFTNTQFVLGEAVDLESGERRLITGVVTGNGNENKLKINNSFSNLLPGDEIEIARGCDHGFNSSCQLRFNNQINFGGFPFIPETNPFRTVVPDLIDEYPSNIVRRG